MNDNITTSFAMAVDTADKSKFLKRDIRFEVTCGMRTQYCVMGSITTGNIIDQINSGVEDIKSKLNDYKRWLWVQDDVTLGYYMERVIITEVLLAALNDPTFRMTRSLLDTEKYVLEFVDQIVYDIIDTENSHIRITKMLEQVTGNRFVSNGRERVIFRLSETIEDMTNHHVVMYAYPLDNNTISEQFSYFGEDLESIFNLVSRDCKCSAQDMIVNYLENNDPETQF